MKKLPKGLIINLITWAVILSAVLSAAYAFNKLTAAKTAPVIYPAQNTAAAKNIPAANANAMPEQTFVIEEDKGTGNIDEEKTDNNEITEIEENIEAKAEELPNEEPAVEMTPEEQQQAKNTEVYNAVQAGDVERLKKALENGGSANSCKFLRYSSDEYYCPENYEDTAFFVALKKRDYNIMKVLIKNGFASDTIVCYWDGCVKDYTLKDFIIEEVNRSQDIELADFLIDNGVYPLTYSAVFFDPTCEGLPPPVRSGQQFTQHLLERGFSPEAVDLSFFMGDKPFAEYLISKGVKPTLCGLRNIEDFKFMFSKGGDLNEQCLPYSETLIEYYSYPQSDRHTHYAKIDILKFLVENGAQVSAKVLGNVIFSSAFWRESSIVDYLSSQIQNPQEVFEKIVNEYIQKINIENIGNSGYNFSDYLEPLAIALKYLPDQEQCSEIITSFINNRDKVQETKDCLILLKQEQEQKSQQKAQ
ncbi:MAG: hypothetical protein LBL61_02110 [Elusimicrobiota bacterium]|jgi:hypothetical protein|nr:hypothetical protein [Elusimicrobiota bacterium]